MKVTTSRSAKSLGRRGGNKTLSLHGRSHFVKMAEARWGKKKAQSKSPEKK